MTAIMLPDCTWCGNPIRDGSTYVKKIDAAGIEHAFHPACEREMWRWLKSDKRTADRSEQ